MAQTQNGKLDLFKIHKHEYVQPKSPKLVDTRSATYLVTAGTGEPGSEVFQAAIGALYGMSYTIKFQSKFAGRDFVVCKLEGIYETAGAADVGTRGRSLDSLSWKLLIRVPDFISERQLEEARGTLHEKGKEGDFDRVCLEAIDEGLCVQMLHVGPYDAEQETVDRMNTFARERRLEPHMAHHEIYLSDPRRVPPERLRTILRQPVTRQPTPGS